MTKIDKLCQNHRQLEMGFFFFLLEMLTFLNKKGQIKYSALNMCNRENIKEKQS